jgi:hypothetical protein
MADIHDSFDVGAILPRPEGRGLPRVLLTTFMPSVVVSVIPVLTESGWLSATLYEVAPDSGRITITNGVQLGSHRALNTAGSWYSKDGRLVRPSHFFTKAKSSVVPIGAPVRVDIELLSTMYQ